MSNLDDILSNFGSTLFCRGQDWKPGDGSASSVEVEVNRAKSEIKAFLLDFIGPAPNTESGELDNYVAALRQELEEL